MPGALCQQYQRNSSVSPHTQHTDVFNICVEVLSRILLAITLQSRPSCTPPTHRRGNINSCRRGTKGTNDKHKSLGDFCLFFLISLPLPQELLSSFVSGLHLPLRSFIIIIREALRNTALVSPILCCGIPLRGHDRSLSLSSAMCKAVAATALDDDCFSSFCGCLFLHGDSPAMGNESVKQQTKGAPH